MLESLDNESLLKALDEEVRNPAQSDEDKIDEVTLELIRRNVYPKNTREHNPNTVFDMVRTWGAYWHIWKGTLNCPLCKADLRDLRLGPPFLRTIGMIHNDRLSTWKCPDCHEEWNCT